MKRGDTIMTERPAAPAPGHPGGQFREGVFLTILAMLGKVSGFAREWLLAFFFGAGVVADAFRVTYELSRNVYTLLFGGHAEVSMVAILSRWRVRNRRRLSLLLIRFLAWLSIGISVLLAGFLGYFAEFAAILQVPNYRPEDAEIVSLLIQWMTPAIPLTVAAYLLGYVLMSEHKFRLFSLLPLFLNVGSILATVAVGLDWLPTVWLSLGYTIAVLSATILLFVDARRMLRGHARPTWERLKYVFAPFWANYWPLLVCALFTQLRIFLEKPIVSELGLGAGAVAALYYAKFLIETPSFTVGLILIRMVLPRFSEMVAMQHEIAVGEELVKLVDVSLWALMPLVALLAAGSQVVVEIVFGYGAFNDQAVAMTSLSLIGWAPALWTGFVGPLVSRVFNAQGRNLILLVAVVFFSIINISLAWGFSQMIGLPGIGLAQAVSQIGSLLFLLPFIPGRQTWPTIRIMLIWWGAAIILYVGLRFVPATGNVYFSGVFLVSATVAGWLVISSLMPSGRRHLRRIGKVLKRSTHDRS